MLPIAIPSKGRPDSKFLAKHEGFFVFVEPQDVCDYIENFPQHTIVDIGLNNMGAFYVRNYILKYFSNRGRKSLWVLDDDISGFFLRYGTKLCKYDIEVVLDAAEKQFAEAGTNLGALDYRNLAWCAKNDMVENIACNCCIYFNGTGDMLYRDFGGNNSDKDFSMRCIQEGYKVHKTTLYAISVPQMGTGSGGMEAHYKSLKRQEDCCDRFVAAWGNEICKKEFKNGVFIVKVNWRLLKSKQSIINF